MTKNSFVAEVTFNGSLQLLDNFQESFLERGLNISVNEKFIFSGGFRWRGHPTGVASTLMGRGVAKKNSWSGRHCLGKPWFVLWQD